MDSKISILRKDTMHPRTLALVSELLDIIPNAELGAESGTTVQITEDIGPQFITFKTPSHQYVFKIIEFRSRAEMGITSPIKKEHSQLVLSNFTSDLGLSVADFIMSIFPISLESNQVINFTVHKDFIFFRMYRFCFREKGPAMEKIGPHLTLRLWRMTEYSGEEKKTFDFKKYVKNLNLL